MAQAAVLENYVCEDADLFVRKSGLSRQQFAEDHVVAGRPVILTDAMRGWAAQNWSPAMFAERFGERKVIVGLGKEWRKLTVSGLAKVMTQSPVPLRRLGPSPYTLYLRNCHIGRVFPELLADFQISPLFDSNWLTQWPLKESFPFSSKELTELFLGPPGAMGPVVHQDAYLTHAWISQVYGKKVVWMLPPDAEGMYPHPTNQGHSLLNDLEFPDSERFPDFDKTKVLSTVLSPGETIFIPAGWWHTAECATSSISLSGNFADASNYGLLSKRFTLKRYQGRKDRSAAWMNRAALSAHGAICRLREM